MLKMSITWIILVAAIFRGIGAVTEKHRFSNMTRVSRATNEEFNTAVHQMQMIARITNGIHLQQGLIKGTIPSDGLISELLNLGPVTPADIYSIDTGKLKQVVQKIEGLPGVLQTDNEVIAIEKRLLMLRSIVGASKGVAALQQPDDKFLAEMNRLKSVNLDWDDLVSYTVALDDFVKKISTVEKSNRDKLSDDVMKELITGISQGCADLEKAVFDVKVPLKSVIMQQAEGIFTNLDLFRKSISEFLKHSKDLSYDSKKDDSIIQKVVKNTKEMGVVIKEVKESVSNFGQLEHLFVSRNHKNTNLIHTPAFYGGPSEFELVSKDINNDWIKKVIPEERDKLAKAVEQLTSLGKLVQDVETSTGSSSDNKLKTVSDIVARFTEVSKLDVSFESLASKLSEIIKSVAAPNLIPKNNKNLEVLLKSISGLYQQVAAADKIIEISKVMGTEETAVQFEKVRALSKYDRKKKDKYKQMEELKKSDAFKQIVEKLKKFPDLFEKSENLVTVLADKNIKNPVFDPANLISKHYKELSTYNQESQNFMKMLDTLRGIKEFESIKAVIEMRQKISNTASAKNLDFSSVADNIEAMKPKVKKLEELIDQMKRLKSQEIDYLVQIADVKKESDTIGMATRGISEIREVMGKRQGVNPITSAVGVLPVLLQNPPKPITKEDKTYFDFFKTFGVDLNKLYGVIDEYVDSVKPITSEKLADYSEIFEKAESVQGIQRNLPAIIGSLQKLKNPNSDDLNEQILDKAIETLTKLEPLNLDFSKYKASFGDSKSSLASMDAIFAAFAQLFVTTTTDPPTTPTTVPPTIPPVIPSAIPPSGNTPKPTGTRGKPSNQGGGQSSSGQGSAYVGSRRRPVETTTAIPGPLTFTSPLAVWSYAATFFFLLATGLFLKLDSNPRLFLKKRKRVADAEKGKLAPNKKTTTPAKGEP